ISDGIQPIKATIAWTDPAGSPPAPSLNPQDLMLVNDLDLRIIDEDGNEHFPWSLNPRKGATARAVNDRDNFRDNVEQVSIEAPEAKKYTLQISHKGNLENNLQAFSLVFSAGVSDGQDKTLYWIGGDGNWNSPDNWSLESNGSSAGLIPDSGTRVVFDQSISSATKASLSADAEVFSLNFFGNSPAEMDLGSHTLLIRSGLRINNQITSIQNGNMEFNSESGSNNIIDMGAAVMEKVEMDVQSGQWRLVSAGVMDKVRIVNATVELDVLDVQVNELRLEPASTLSGRIRNIRFKESIFIGLGASLNVTPAFRFIGSQGRFSDLTRTDGLSLIVEGD